MTPGWGTFSVKPTWIRRAQLVARSVVPALIDQRGANLIGGKPAILKESGLLCTFGRGSGAGSSELAPAHVGRKRLPVDIARTERQLDRICFYSLDRKSVV